MPDWDLLSMLGIKIPPLFSGLAGGVVGAWVDGKSGVKAWCVYAACGALTGAYLGEWSSHFMPYGESISAGFLVGSSVMIVMRLLRGYLNKWSTKVAGGNGSEGK